MTAREREIARLRAEAREMMRQGDAALDAGDLEAGKLLIHRGILRETVADELEGAESAPPLQKRHQSGTTEGMVSAARAHISAGRSKQARGGKAHPLIEAASKRGHTYRSLATAIEKETSRKTPHSIISRALSGSRPIRRSAARVIEKLTGYEASDKNWPGGWAAED